MVYRIPSHLFVLFFLIRKWHLFNITNCLKLRHYFFFHSDTSVMNHARHIMHYVHSSGLWYRHPLSNNVHCNLQYQNIFCFLKFLKQAWDLTFGHGLRYCIYYISLVILTPTYISICYQNIVNGQKFTKT